MTCCVLVLATGVTFAEPKPKLDAPKHARTLCTKDRKIGDATIHIEIWASKASVASLVSDYERASGLKAVKNEELGGWTFQTEKVTLSVLPAANLKGIPICDPHRPDVQEHAVVWRSEQR